MSANKVKKGEEITGQKERKRERLKDKLRQLELFHRVQLKTNNDVQWACRFNYHYCGHDAGFMQHHKESACRRCFIYRSRYKSRWAGSYTQEKEGIEERP